LSIPKIYTIGKFFGDVGMAKDAKEKPIGDVKLDGYRCRCGHEWLRRGSERPRVCPACKSPNWDRPKLFERPKR
jgi:predicted Zn-ribbon and HTH transcriptional regulator